MKDVFRTYMGALAEALRQDLPDVSDTRAEFAVDGIPFVFTADEEGPSIFSCAVVGALPGEEAARSRVFAELLHAQFCFSESCGFCFGVDADDSFVLLQSMVNPECVDERHFVERMEKFVQLANVWRHLLQTYRDFEGDDYVQYNLHGDEPVMTKMRMSVLAADRIKQLERFDILVAMAAGQDMENYEMIDEEMFDHGVEHPGYSHVVVDAIGRDFEDIVRANPDAYSPQ